MHDLKKIANPYNDDKVISNCSIFGMMNVKGDLFYGNDILHAIANMHERGNGLGGGFAIYGLYPDFKDYYAFHIMFQSRKGKELTEDFLKHNFEIEFDEEIPTKPTLGIDQLHAPIVWRYFVQPQVENPDYIVKKVMEINTQIQDAFVFSSGKNSGIFKGVGYPEQIGEYFRLEEYKGYLWTAHGRFPTNSQAWWGGAHPFGILDWSVVHNGEISSYGTNKRFLEMYGYICTLFTDTEVVAYAVDLLMRRHNLPIDLVAKVFSAPLWSEIDALDDEILRNQYIILRKAFGELLLNGPFTIIIAHEGEMIGLTDRIRLRPLSAGIDEKNNMLYLSSEEGSIRLVCPDIETTWIPKGGEPIIGRLKDRRVLYNKEAVHAVGES
ncbi:MAG: hypothetical protein ACFFA5_05040 [Promethearchaeota archaeon]